GVALAIVSLIGGGLGALLLLGTPTAVFERVVPYLVLVATAVFALGPKLSARWADASAVGLGREDRRRLLALMGIQLLISLYGGYFGGGVGILILAALGFFGLRRYHHANALRTVLSASVNSVAFLTFVLAGAVAWREALVMVAGAVLGGYGAV